ncbi:MAG: OB-fold domain-containing protein [Myxococcota bacterium]|jgi:uncharacterized OB-fold protein|nr:OB-fold domain-containing protein [Myxococcota bacterium]
MSKARVPAAAGWFTLDDSAPALLGTRCKACGTYFFPREEFSCRNPRCGASDFEETPLSTRGKLWSFTDNRYPPPKPYVAPDPFVPYAVAAVELEREKMVVLGQVVAGVGCDQLAAGMEMELVLDTLYEDDANEYVIWKWRPCDAR